MIKDVIVQGVFTKHLDHFKPIEHFQTTEMANTLHLKGFLLFLFIPLVLYLFVQHPFGLLPSFLLAITIMLGHRMVARPFFLRNARLRCFWCGQTKNPRTSLEVKSGDSVAIELCTVSCTDRARKFFDLAFRYRTLLRLGIFLPLVWYTVTMLLNDFQIFSFPENWNRFIFQFFIAATVVIVSFAYRSGRETAQPEFPFPIHNLFLLGANNTLMVFRLVGFWWLAASLYFLSIEFSRSSGN